jgi:hypothetical protein
MRHQEPDEGTAARAADRQANADAASRTDNEQQHDAQDITAEEAWAHSHCQQGERQPGDARDTSYEDASFRQQHRSQPQQSPRAKATPWRRRE